MKSITVLVIALVCLFIEAFATVNFALYQSMMVRECLSSNIPTIPEIRELRAHRIFYTPMNERQMIFLKCVFNKIGVMEGDHLHKDEYFGPLLGCKKTRDFYFECSEVSGVYDNLYCLVQHSKDYKRERCPTSDDPCAEENILVVMRSQDKSTEQIEQIAERKQRLQFVLLAVPNKPFPLRSHNSS